MWKFSAENLLELSEDEAEEEKEEWSFPLVGPVGENLLCPSCVAISQTGEFLVSDPTSCFIVVYSKDGEFLSHFSTIPQSLFYLFSNLDQHRPHGVAWLSTRLIVYTQPKGSCVNICNWKGQITTSIKGKPLYEPYGVAVDMTDRIFVTDREKGRILCYNVEGKLLQSIGSFTSANVGLSRPHSIVIDASGNLLVNDIQRNRIAIKMFKRNGDFEETLLTDVCAPQDPDTDQIITEVLAVSETNNIFLTDTQNKSILRISLLHSGGHVVDNEEEEEEEDVHERKQYSVDTMKVTETFSGMAVKPGSDQLICVCQEEMKMKLFPWKPQNSNGGLSHGNSESVDT